VKFIGKENTVPGEGPRNAKIMLVGQNPGKEEVKQGRPFVGRSGKYLDKVLRENYLERKKLFITSVVKQTTPGNRKPTAQEIRDWTVNPKSCRCPP
jgi:DNA polymerase